MIMDEFEKNGNEEREEAAAGEPERAEIEYPEKPGDAAAVFGPQTAAEKAVGAVVAFVIAAACYYHVKHLFIPDVDYGVVKCLRRFNALALLYGILCMLEMTALAYQSTMLLIAAGGLMTLVIAVIVPVMDKGVRAWRT